MLYADRSRAKAPALPIWRELDVLIAAVLSWSRLAYVVGTKATKCRALGAAAAALVARVNYPVPPSYLNQGWQGRWGAGGAGRQKAAPPAGARGTAKFRGRWDSKPTFQLEVSKNSWGRMCWICKGWVALAMFLQGKERRNVLKRQHMDKCSKDGSGGIVQNVCKALS